ncbi:hypothetical protein [Tautonia plasticadhaerens]|uniref:Uncharacterized protein n=1 Tax=Tautonia plasticadhaerens TaxID=2527974 RepID=A0A518H2P7_9BACT|nr:hypothetical protein [Tautonia plasticadhaerens]QDV35129.1 hypothetical protein ElP_30310 [Tautonia plasticadhaerens]
MADHWRGYRLLVLGGRRFRWTCSFNEPLDVHSRAYAEHGGSWPPDRLLVRPEDGPHRLLAVEWPACRGPVVRPALVRRCVEEAIRRGWPDSGAALVLDGPGPAEEAGP